MGRSAVLSSLGTWIYIRCSGIIRRRRWSHQYLQKKLVWKKKLRKRNQWRGFRRKSWKWWNNENRNWKIRGKLKMNELKMKRF